MRGLCGLERKLIFNLYISFASPVLFRIQHWDSTEQISAENYIHFYHQGYIIFAGLQVTANYMPTVFMIKCLVDEK